MVQIVPIIQKRVLVHPAGPFTIFFWCPLIKWFITFANIKDLQLPTKQINSKQQAALKQRCELTIYTYDKIYFFIFYIKYIAIALSGLIWTRYCFVITPVNYSLAAVNFFMGLTGCYQLYRKWQAGQLLD